jgi:20S proteasome alpha/beta subunit
VTVCIAALFRFNYAKMGDPLDVGTAVLTLSDRMVTAGDVQYEPNQLKIGHITPHVIILIAGEYSVHSQAILATHKQVDADVTTSPFNVALIYGQALQAVRQRQAEDLILAPIGLNTETFLAQQKDMSDRFVDSITSQLQGFSGPEVEALIVGMDNGIGHIYEVDKYGTVRCFDDIGFAAIGIGAWHAKSRLMQAGYVNTLGLAPALAATFAAKKAAEIAPGVGKSTDIRIVARDYIFPLWENTALKAALLYDEYENKRLALSLDAIEQLQASLNERKPEALDKTGNVIAEEGT